MLSVSLCESRDSSVTAIQFQDTQILVHTSYSISESLSAWKTNLILKALSTCLLVLHDKVFVYDGVCFAYMPEHVLYRGGVVLVCFFF